MKPVFQSIHDFKHGDCFRACVASILETPLEEIPNFMRDGRVKFNDYVDEWLVGFPFLFLYFEVESEEDRIHFERQIQECYVIAIGKSIGSIGQKDSDRYHAVVWKDGKVVHDPAGHNAMIGKPTSYVLFVNKMNPNQVFKMRRDKE